MIDFSSRWSRATCARTSALWRSSPASKVFLDLDAMISRCGIVEGETWHEKGHRCIFSRNHVCSTRDYGE